MVSSAPLWSYDISRQERGTAVVALTGELDLHCAGAMRHLLRALIDDPAITAVVVDLAAVTFLDSAALGALINAYQFADQSDRRFTVVSLTDTVRRVFEITGMLDILSPSGSARSGPA